MAAGLLLGISELFTTLINNHFIESNAYIDLLVLILSVLGTTCMSFLTIYVGINSAKVFKCTTILGAMIGALVIVDDLGHIASQIQNIIDSIPYFNLKFYDQEILQNSLLYTGKGGVIGVIGGVWILSKIEHALRKVVPETLDLIITPLVCVLISGLLMLLIIMPVSGIIADSIAKGLNYLNTSDLLIIKGLYGFLLGALYLPMVLLGLHQGLLPLYMVEISQNGFTTMICPQLMAGFAQIGAAICIYIKARSINHTTLTKTIAGSLPAALLGIGEPLIFGMSLPIAIVFLPIGIAAGCAGAFISLMECKALSYGPSALLGIVTMKPEYMITFAIGGLISVVLGFLFTFLIVKKKRVLKHKESTTGSNAGQDFNDLIHS